MNSQDLSRQHDDPAASDLSPLVLDRQRIVHSAAFRRLQYKTQVFVALEGDHYRTRLTHTLEVAHLARCIAAALGVDADLAEVVALAHDVGHAPFGHAGERALDQCLRDHGGFEHNSHALRVVEYLEHPYPQFRGLNLTRVVRECLAKHTTRYDQPGDHPLQDGKPAPIEGQLAALADRLAYGLHDLQDGLHAGLLEPGWLEGVELWSAAYEGPRPSADPSWRGYLRPTMDRLQQALVEDVVATTRREAGASLGSCMRAGAPIVSLSAELDRDFQVLEGLLRERVYKHQRLVRMDAKARRVVTDVFRAYVQEPALMPERYARRVVEQGVERVATDYIAGMTDRFCLREHARLFDPTMDV